MIDQSSIRFCEENPPRCRDYIKALESLIHDLSEDHVKTLRFQFSQPGRATTSRELSVFFDDRTDKGKSGNLRYGKLGSVFAEELNFDTQPAKDHNYWYRAISTWNGTGWTMRPQLAEALIDCGIVDRELDGIDLDFETAEFSSIEGRRVIVQHFAIERDASLVRKKKQSANSFNCEICDFDAEAVYGHAYCEVHHKKVLGEIDGEQEIGLDDLAIVCANCHRQLHRQYPALTVEDLRRQLGN